MVLPAAASALDHQTGHGARDSNAALHLNLAQSRALARLESQSRAESAHLRSQIAQLRTQLEELYGKYVLDLHQIHAIHQEINQAQARLLEIGLMAQSRLREIITAKQFEALQASERAEDHDEESRRERRGKNGEEGVEHRKNIEKSGPYEHY